MNLVTSRNILNYKLEAVLDTPERGVAIRREMLSPKLPVHSALVCLPYKDYDYSKVFATCIFIKCVVLVIVITVTFSGVYFRLDSPLWSLDMY